MCPFLYAAETPHAAMMRGTCSQQDVHVDETRNPNVWLEKHETTTNVVVAPINNRGIYFVFFLFYFFYLFLSPSFVLATPAVPGPLPLAAAPVRSGSAPAAPLLPLAPGRYRGSIAHGRSSAPPVP